MRLQFFAVQQAHGWVVVLLVQFADPVGEFLNLPRFDGDMNVVRVVVAIDGVLADQRLSEIQGLDGQIEQAPRIVAADVGGERLLARGQPKNSLSAAASRGPVADGACLEQGHAIAPLREMQCSRATRNAAAEHGYIGLERAAQRLALGPGALAAQGCGGGGRGGVVGRGGRMGQVQGGFSSRKCLRSCGY